MIYISVKSKFLVLISCVYRESDLEVNT